MEKINEYICEFYFMGRGVLIKNPMEEIWLNGGIKMSRMGLKHVVESRMEDDYSIAQIVAMIYRIPEVFNDPEIDIENPNQKYWAVGSRGNYTPTKSAAQWLYTNKMVIMLGMHITHIIGLKRDF